MPKPSESEFEQEREREREWLLYKLSEMTLDDDVLTAAIRQSWVKYLQGKWSVTHEGFLACSVCRERARVAEPCAEQVFDPDTREMADFIRIDFRCPECDHEAGVRLPIMMELSDIAPTVKHGIDGFYWSNDSPLQRMERVSKVLHDREEKDLLNSDFMKELDEA